MLGFIFFHGWGFDRSFFKKLSELIKCDHFLFYDRGYFNLPYTCTVLPKDIFLVAVTHSIGLNFLLSSNVKVDCVVCLQGFLDFSFGDRKVILDKMIERFELDYKKELRNFYLSCGIKPVSFCEVNKNLLREDLNLLKMDCRNEFSRRELKTLVLGSCNDPIVPTSVIKRDFSNLRFVTGIEFCQNGLHALGYKESVWVKDRILDFVDEVYCEKKIW